MTLKPLNKFTKFGTQKSDSFKQSAFVALYLKIYREKKSHILTHKNRHLEIFNKLLNMQFGVL